MHGKKHIWCGIMIVLIVIFDQLTKHLAVISLKNNNPFELIKGFVRFNYAENNGMAFSLFSGARWIFVAVTLVVCIAALWYLFSNRCKSLWLYWSIAVVVSGGIGNLIDRALHGYVVDFIEPVFVNFAVFNIADCAVSLGAVSLIACLVLDLFKKENKGE
ncbi:MAG: signal peptidase II [Clostridiales bacterium]|nr:signal peptidase II [Clostridiales bacterium]